MKIVFATGNKNKMREIREIMAGWPDEILSMKEAGIDIDINEDGTTFEANALIKARAVAAELKARELSALVLADDSGLEIDALGGEPGVYSARYMGEDTSYQVKCARLLERLASVPEQARTARFRCVIAGVYPEGQEVTADGAVEGRIAYEPAGANGFGYDPIFYYPPAGKTLAQISEEEKNGISHRGEALRKMARLLAERR